MRKLTISTENIMKILLSHSLINNIPLIIDEEVIPEPSSFDTRTLSTLNAIRSGGRIDTVNNLHEFFTNYKTYISKLVYQI